MTDTSSSPPFALVPSDPDWTMLGRFFRGECSADEIGAIARWEAAAPENPALIAFMRQVWNEAAADLPEVDEDRGWSVVRSRIAAEASAEPTEVPVLPLYVDSMNGASRRRWLGWAVAAAATFIVGGWLLWRTDGPAALAAGSQAREYRTVRGQRAEVMLDDGTRVWLNVESRLRVPVGYGVGKREVAVEGEVYFAVEHDSTRPFLVRSRGAVSEDLGTEFNVRAYADDRAVTVTVVSGRVAVRVDAAAARIGTPLDAGQKAEVDPVGRVTITDADLARGLGWRDGQLTFQERPLAEALRELERWYDLEIVLDDPSLARVPLTASFSRRTRDQALAVIANVLDAQYTRHDRQVHFWTKPVQP